MQCLECALAGQAWKILFFIIGLGLESKFMISLLSDYIADLKYVFEQYPWQILTEF